MSYFNQNRFDPNSFNDTLDGQQQNNFQQNINPQQQQMMMQGGYPPQQFQDPQQQMYQQQFMNQGGFPQQFPQQMGMPPGQQQMMYQQQVQMVNNQMGNMGLGPQMNDPNMMYQQQMMGMPNQGFQQQQMGGMPMGGGFDQHAAPQQMQAQQQAAPQTEEPAKTQFKPEASAFNLNVTEYIPAGKLANTKEQFPDLGDLMDGGGKGKGKKKKKGVVSQAAPQKQDEDDGTAWKGKKSTFFEMKQLDGPPADPQNPNNFELSQDQWSFMFQHYPEYCAAPYEMMTWLRGQARAHEDTWAKPRDGGMRAPGVAEEEEPSLDAPERGIGASLNQKTKKKKDTKAQQQQAEEQARIKAEKIRARKLEEGRAEPAKAEVVKAYKDKDVTVDKSELNEVDKNREPCSMVFIGHVDAGKSTICGNLMLLNGVVDDRTIQKYKAEAKEKGRDSWWLAYVMDVSDEEKAKGKTVEVGRAQFDTPSKKYTIFDAPGHKNYVPNMIMGAALADVAGLVISARKGEFEAGFEKDGQTREHAQLAKSLGVQRLVVIVNKMDDCHWQKARYQEIQDGLEPFLAATGYGPKDVIWVPIAGLQGHNIIEPVPKGTCNWYTGPTLMQILDELTLDARHADGPLRIPIIDKMKDPALVCHGKVEHGTVTLGDKLAVLPSGAPAQVLQLMDGKGQPVEYALPGENVQIKINVADDEHIQRGFVLCHRDSPMPVTEVFEAEIDVLDLVEYKPIITKGYTCMMHIHTYHDEVVIKDIVKAWEKNDRGEVTEKLKPQFVRSQTKMICRVTTKGPVSLEKFEIIQQMGRFTLRDEGKTICVGKVLKYKPYDKKVAAAAATAAGPTATPAAASTAATTKVASAAQEELVFDMETGETRPKKADLPQIAEGDEDEDKE